MFNVICVSLDRSLHHVFWCSLFDDRSIQEVSALDKALECRVRGYKLRTHEEIQKYKEETCRHESTIARTTIQHDGNLSCLDVCYKTTTKKTCNHAIHHLPCISDCWCDARSVPCITIILLNHMHTVNACNAMLPHVFCMRMHACMHNVMQCPYTWSDVKSTAHPGRVIAQFVVPIKRNCDACRTQSLPPDW